MGTDRRGLAQATQSPGGDAGGDLVVGTGVLYKVSPGSMVRRGIPDRQLPVRAAGQLREAGGRWPGGST